MQANNKRLFDENTLFVKESQNPVIFAPFQTDFTYMKTWFTFLAFLLCSSALVAQTASINKGCAPLNVSFTAPPGSSTFFWDFGDTETSDVQNPGHVYTTPGDFTVEFRETSGGPVLYTTTITIYAKPTLIDIVADPASGCPPTLVNLQALINADDSIEISRYAWVYGDGQSDVLNTDTSSHLYTVTGNFGVSVGLTTNRQGCDVTLTESNAVTMDEAPTVSFTGDTISACEPPLTVNFINSTPDNPDYVYDWDFGNGLNSTDRNPVPVTYTEIGRYTVTLTVNDTTGCEATATRIVNVGPPLIDLVYPDTTCTFLPFVLENNNLIDNAVWDFGNNSTSSRITGTNNYTVTFTQRGVQTVSLTLTSPDGECTSDTTFSIFVDEADATFTSVPTFSCNKTLTSVFTPNTNLSGATYQWTFEGGDTDTVFAPTYTYENEDTTIHSINGGLYFDTRLRVTNPSGCVATFRVTDTIHQPNALFTIDDIQGCLPLTVTFSDSSSSFSPLTEWFWDFGDGSTETRNDSNSVTHTYTSAGEYDARLIVTNQNGCMDTSYVIQILVGDQISGVDFMADQLDVCPGDTVRFTDLTANTDIDAWHFETDRGRSFHCFQDPSLAWAFERETGMMDVSLTVEYNGCYTTVTKDDYINVRGPIAVLDYEIDCDNPFTVSFRDSSLDATSVLWEFGDTMSRSMAFDTIFTFPDTGNYVVKLTAINGTSGCPASVDSATIYIRDIKANITLDTILCLGQEYQLDATLSEGVDDDCWKGYTWYFPNVERPITTQDSSISHMFNQPDSQRVRLVVEDINGCTDTAEIDVTVFGIYPDLTADDLSICNPATVTFGNATTADTTLVSIEWEFGDPAMGTSTDSLPVYTYTMPPENRQNYVINVSFEDAVGCPGSGSLTLNWYEPVSNITPVPQGICLGDEIIFTASDFTQEGSFLNFNWDFGNGEMGTQRIDTIAYTNPGQTGDVMVQLQFTEVGSGCMGETSTTISIQEYPIADLSASKDTTDQLCPGIIDFVDVSATNFPPLTQIWDFGNGTQPISGDSVATNYEVGSYTLELIVSTSFGCADTTTRDIEVIGPTGDFTFAPKAICFGDTLEFELQDTTDVTGWLWDFGDGNQASNVSPVKHAYTFVPGPGKRVITLTLVGPEGCETFVRDSVQIQNTTADFDIRNQLDSLDNTFCENELVIFSDESEVADIYTWDFGDGTVINNTTPGNQNYVYTTAGTYTVRLEVEDNALGCSNAIEKNITIAESPTAELMDSGAACAGIPHTITITGYDPTINDYIFSPSGTIDNNGVVTVTPDVTTTYQLVVTDIADGCSNTAQTLTEVFPPLDPLPAQPIDTSVCPGNSIDLAVNFSTVPPNIIYAWSGSGVNSLSCADCPNPTYTAPGQGTVPSEIVTITVDPGNGCPTETLTYNISITEGEFFDMPNSFTPGNADNVNDFFNYVIIEEERGKPVTVNRFQVFNRFGNLVYDNETPGQGWDGMQDGEPAPSDTYVYIIELTLDDCLNQTLNGNVMLIR